MKRDKYYEIIEKAQKADDAYANKHLKAFVNSFIIKAKRSRWSELLCKRPKKIFEMCHKLEEIIDKRHCFLTMDLDDYYTERIGLFYDFLDPPLCITGNDALTLGIDNDAIFSLAPGKRALLFSHEGRVWSCRKD